MLKEIKMNKQLRLLLNGCAVLACFVSIGAAGSLLYESLQGRRDDFGAIGNVILLFLIVGQCRALCAMCFLRERVVAGQGSVDNERRATTFRIPE